jgi:hypothetical protein
MIHDLFCFPFLLYPQWWHAMKPNTENDSEGRGDLLLFLHDSRFIQHPRVQLMLCTLTCVPLDRVKAGSGPKTLRSRRRPSL